MRRFLSLALVLSINLSFVGCSKKEEQRELTQDAAPAATTESETSPGAGAAGTSEVDDATPAFSLSGSTPGGTGTNAPPATSISSNTPDVQPAEWLMQPYPFYPLSLRMQGIEGRVIVRVLINTQGRVDQAEVVTSSEPRFNEYAVASMRASRFIPQRENGQPVPLMGEFSVAFISEFGTGTLSRNSPLANLSYHDGTYYRRGADGQRKPAEIEKPIRFSFLSPLIPPGTPAAGSLKATIKVTVSPEGQVLNPSVTDATTPEFGRALEEVLPFWQFIPRMKAGRPSQVSVTFPYVHNFTAGNAPAPAN